MSDWEKVTRSGVLLIDRDLYQINYTIGVIRSIHYVRKSNIVAYNTPSC